VENYCEVEENDCDHLNLNLNLNYYHLSQEIQESLGAVVCKHHHHHTTVEKANYILHKAHYIICPHFVLKYIVIGLHPVFLPTFESSHVVTKFVGEFASVLLLPNAFAPVDKLLIAIVPVDANVAVVHVAICFHLVNL